MPLLFRCGAQRSAVDVTPRSAVRRCEKVVHAMNFTFWEWAVYLGGLFLLGLLVMGLMFAFVYGCEKV
jgi:hypothetical protein